MALPEEVQKQVTPNYEVNYDDPRFGKVESEENQALTELDKTYDGMVADSDKYFDEQIDATKDWADKQTQLQQEQTEFAIEKIEQQKDQAQKDYIKEQSGAYVDWQKQSNAYGADAEKRATNGLTNTGFSESSQVSMYNTYQNRVALAKESLNKAMLDYDNAIKDAMLQNNAAIAEIAIQSLQQRLELSLQGFQYKNQLLLEQSDKQFQIKQYYDSQWQTVLDNIYREDTLAEDVREYNQSVAFEEKQALYESGWDKIGFGVMPTKEERLALGMTEAECRNAISKVEASQSVSSGGGSGETENTEDELIEYHLDKTTLNNLKKTGNWYEMWDYLSDRSNNGEELIENGAKYGLTEGAIRYYNDKKEITDLDVLWDLLVNYRKEEYAGRSAKDIMAGAYTKDEFYGSGHMMSAYDTYAEYLTKNFGKFISL